MPGRKPWKVTDEVLDKIRSLAAKGLTLKQIALALGISETTLFKYKKYEKRINEAYQQGRAQGLSIVANSLFEQATQKGSVPAMIFILKQHGWSDKVENDHKGEIQIKVVRK